MTNLKIIVAGATATGKSTVAQLIYETLKDEGFDVINSDDDEINYAVDNDIQKLRVENTLMRRPNIEILTQRVLRNSSTD